MTPPAAPAGTGSRAAGFGRDWWVRALAGHERSEIPGAGERGSQAERPAPGLVARTDGTGSLAGRPDGGDSLAGTGARLGRVGWPAPTGWPAPASSPAPAGTLPSPADWPAPIGWPACTASPSPLRLAAGPRPPVASDVTGCPAWIGVAEQAVAMAAPPDVLPPMGTWPEAFAVPLRPFLAGARDGVIAAARRLLLGHTDPEAMAEAFTAVLGRQLARIAVRTMVHELAVARAEGRLAGVGGRQRFEDFIRQQCEPSALAALLQRYPVLARLLGTSTWLATQACQELLARLAADRLTVIATLLNGTDPGPVVAIEPGLGDPHQHGRSVTLVRFADGRKVIYKPRSLAAHVLFGEVAGWLNQRIPHVQLRTAPVVARPGYGWLGFVAHRPLAVPGDAENFYRREGVLLAALYALNAADMHWENLIACGDQPVLVDVETLFHPSLPAPHTVSDDPAARALEASVQGTGLLPSVTVGENGLRDQSGMGGDQDAPCPDGVLDWEPPASDLTQLIRRAAPSAPGRPAHPGNRPYCGGEAAEPGDHEAAVLDGFRLGYDAIAAGRQEFSRLLERHGDAEVRVVIRPSRGYARLLDESTHPDLLRDAQDRDEALGVLHQASAAHPLWSRMVRHELADLWAGDIPLVTARPVARDLYSSDGQKLPDLLGRPGLRSVLDKLAAMGEADRRDQEWVISASLATRRRTGGGHRDAEPAQHQVTAAGWSSRLLTLACGLADQIVAAGTTGPGEARVNWLGLQFVDDTQWMVLPMGAGLADGYLGVALFLAQLAGLTGIPRYAEVARRAVRPLPRLLGVLADRPELLGAVGCGVTEGLAGISYGLARMATLLDEAELADWAGTAVGLTASAAGLTASAAGLTALPGWADGTAGCLAAMTAVESELGSATSGALARACAARLAELVERTDGRCVPDGDPVPAGFAAGPAGIGWALSRFAATAAEPAYQQAGQRAVRCGGSLIAGPGDQGSHGWCRGIAGRLAARSCLSAGPGSEDGADSGDTGEIGPAARRLADAPARTDLSLCHGELGIAEVLTVLASADRPAVAPAVLRHRTGLIAATLSRSGRFCGTPGGVCTPGLLTGLAGIGYGLVRLAFPERVPSVLFLEPTPPASAGTRPPGEPTGP